MLFTLHQNGRIRTCTGDQSFSRLPIPPRSDLFIPFCEMVVQVSTNRSSRTLLKLYSMVTSLQADHLLSAAVGTVGLEPTTYVINPLLSHLSYAPISSESRTPICALLLHCGSRESYRCSFPYLSAPLVMDLNHSSDPTNCVGKDLHLT